MRPAREIADLFLSLARRIVEPLASPEAFAAEAQRLGWALPALTPGQASALGNLVAPARDFTRLQTVRDDLLRADPVRLLAKFQELEPALARLLSAMQSVNAAGAALQPPLSTPDFWADFGPALVERGLIGELQARSTTAFALAWGVGFVESRAMPATPAGRFAHTRTALNWSRLRAWLADPGGALRSVAVGANGELRHTELWMLLQQVGLALGVPVTQRKPARALLASFYAASNPVAQEVAVLSFPLVSARGDVDQPYAEVTLNMLPVPAKADVAGRPRRIFMWPAADAAANVPVAPGWTLRLAGSVGQGASHGVIVDPRAAAQPRAEVLLEASAVVEGSVEALGTPAQPWVFGDPDGITITLRSALAGIRVRGTASDAEVIVAAGTADGGGKPAVELRLVVGGPDDFLPKLLGTREVLFTTDIDVSYSTKTGLRIDSSEPLELGFNVGLQVGPLRIGKASIGLQRWQDGLALHAVMDVGGTLGPLSFQTERMGFRVGLSPQFSDAAKTRFTGLAPIVGVEPPRGVGLAIKAPSVEGGGYLFFDPQKEQYAGIVQLSLADTIAVKGVGLLTTRMPDGSKGFSLLVIVTAEGFSPIPLGFGFTLTGIGGLLGINRTAAVDTLRRGLRNGTLESILFPADPVRDAPRVVSDAGAVFPPAPGRHVFGPMAKITWGTPTILTMHIGLVLEVPEPVRLLMLGRVVTILPEEKNALIAVRMDALGTIDFATGEVALDALLYDSRIANFTLTGEMALRASWGAKPSFLLAIGGFNPRFPAPPGFPALARMALALSGDDPNARLRMEAYLAITSNTVQFGARLDFYFALPPFSLEGRLGFDTLFHFAPFGFVADLAAQLALRQDGALLTSVALTLSLSGPAPWHAWGTGQFFVAGVKQSFAFDARYGAGQDPALPAPVDVKALLVAALTDARNWSGELPADERPVVTVRSGGTAAVGLRMHPLAQVAVRERVAPLEMKIGRFGNAPVSGENQFALTAVRSDTGAPVTAAQKLTDAFALAQFSDLSDDQKLALPAFTQRPAGVRLGGRDVAYGYEPALDAPLTYETLMIAPEQPAQRLAPYVMPAGVLDSAIAAGAAALAARRTAGASTA